MTSRYILKPLRLWDCDRPVQASAAYLFPTVERTRALQQPPVYLLNHVQHDSRPRITQSPLDEIEAEADRVIHMMWEGSGLEPQDLDIYNPYDGHSIVTGPRGSVAGPGAIGGRPDEIRPTPRGRLAHVRQGSQLETYGVTVLADAAESMLGNRTPHRCRGLQRGFSCMTPASMAPSPPQGDSAT